MPAPEGPSAGVPAGREGGSPLAKRILDVVLAIGGLVVLAPVFAVIALLIKMESRGPVFFRQERVGCGFHRFRIFKFRTMVVGAERLGGLITAGGDSRVTRVGRILRATKLDEWPQLLNVLGGEMSLVGSRPEVPAFVERFRADYQEILRLPPGMTDLASLKYRDEETLLGRAPDPELEYLRVVLPDKLRLAKAYVRRSSVGFDLLLVVVTVLVLLGVTRGDWLVNERGALAGGKPSGR